MYDPPAITLTVGQYAVTIFVLKILFPRNSIHYQGPRFYNYCPNAIPLYDTLSTAMLDVPPLCNISSEVLTPLYTLLILLFFNHPSILLYIFYLMVILLQ